MRVSKLVWRSRSANLPLAKPSAAPLTPSAALTVVAKAAAMAVKREYFIVGEWMVQKVEKKEQQTQFATRDDEKEDAETK